MNILIPILIVAVAIFVCLKIILLPLHPLATHKKIYGVNQTDDMKWMFGLSKTKMLKQYSQRLTESVVSDLSLRDRYPKYLSMYFHPDGNYIKWNPYSNDHKSVPRFIIDATPKEVIENGNYLTNEHLISVKRGSKLDKKIHEFFVFIYGEGYDKKEE